MSLSLDRQLELDRALRDAARRLVEADISHLRSDLDAQNIASRFAARMSDGAVDLYEEAAQTAENNRGILLTLIAALALWFARNPLLSLLADDANGAEDNENTGQPEPDADPDVTRSNGDLM